MKRGLWLAVTWAVLAGWPLSAQEGCRLVPLDAGAVHACVTGEGPTTVVLAAGAGQTLRTWGDVVPRLSSTARVVTFDRPGLGQSPAGVPPRTPTRIAAELHEVLRLLEIQGPVLLVGHSMGGVHVLRYATLYPEQVVGVITLDMPPPGFEEARLALLTPSEREERRRLLAEGLDGVPDAVRLEREGSQDPREWDFTGFPGTLPLSVVVADSQDFGGRGSQEDHRRLWIEGSRAWVVLSTGAYLTIAEGSGHMVHHDHRELVIQEVLKLAGRASGR